jgi:signal transduction histidine kinase
LVPIIRLFLAIYVLMISLYLFVLPEQLQAGFDDDYSEPLFLLLLIALLGQRAIKAKDSRQRLFWRLMTLAFLSWLVVSLIGFGFSGRHFPQMELVEDCIYLVFYGALAVGIELRLDRNEIHFATQRYVTAALGSVLMVLATFGYFAILPQLAAPEPYSPPYALHGTLDAYITIRFFVAYILTRNSSWKRLYAVLVAAFLLMVVSDFLSLAYQSDWTEYRPGHPLNLIWYVWYAVAILATNLPLDNAANDDSDPSWQSQVATSALLGFGAVLPFLHAAGYALGWFSQDVRFLRDVFIAFWIALVSSLFYGLYFFIRDKVDALDVERAHAENKADQFEDQLNRELRLRSLGRLSAGLAHDFGNTVTAIAMYAGLISKKSGRGEPVDDEVRGLTDGVSYAQDLVNKLKVFGSSGSQVTTQSLDFSDEVRKTLEIIRPSLSRNIELDFDERSPGMIVLAEAPMVHQVVTNYVYNAADALHGSGRIDVQLDYAEPGGHCASCGEELDGHFVQLIVSDSGPGVDAELASRVFEPLISSKPLGKGSGLGLSTVHGVMHSIGGHVGLRSKAGGGAEFSAHFRPADTSD